MTIGMLWNFSKNLGNTFIHKIFQKSFLAFLEIINNNRENADEISTLSLALEKEQETRAALESRLESLVESRNSPRFCTHMNSKSGPNGQCGFLDVFSRKINRTYM